MLRKDFIQQLSILGIGTIYSNGLLAYSNDPHSEFSKHLRPVGRTLELEDHYVW